MIESVPVEVDEATLAMLGWTASDVRARLVTETEPTGVVVQRVAVAGTAQFTAEYWTERFSETGNAPLVLLTLNRRGGVGLPSYAKAVVQDAEIAAKGPIRFTQTSEAWSAYVPIASGDLEIRLTGYDLHNIDRFFALPGDMVNALPVMVRNESTWPSLRVKPRANAEMTHEKHGDQLRVHIDGVVEMATVGELLADRAVHEPGPYDALFRAPWLPVPGFVIEVTDDSDFLLAKRTIQFHGGITVDETTGAPSRAPRFVADLRAGSATYAGTPAQVVLRILDATDVQTI